MLTSPSRAELEKMQKDSEYIEENAFENRFASRSFTTTLSDGCSVALEEGGAKRELTFANRTEYVRKTLYARMKECEL